MTSRELTLALARACRLDVIAMKPGNVSVLSPGHGMRARDFLLSAKVAAPALALSGASVGERIVAAVTATQSAVGTNTNLGIVLLLAPLAKATEKPGRDLRTRLEEVLSELTIADAEQCFQAIRVAHPAGLGRAAQADVHAPATADLRAVMRLAASRDSIAMQYANGFREVFELGLPILVTQRRRWRSLAWATVACYLRFMVEMPDTHIVRKHGLERAREVQARVREVENAMKACENPRRLMMRLAAFDRELKERGINPGTSADLTVASLSVLILQERFF